MPTGGLVSIGSHRPRVWLSFLVLPGEFRTQHHSAQCTEPIHSRAMEIGFGYFHWLLQRMSTTRQAPTRDL